MASHEHRGVHLALEASPSDTVPAPNFSRLPAFPMTNTPSTTSSTKLIQYPPPPESLPAALHEQWSAVVRSFPADHWRAPDLPLLLEMLRATDTANTLAARIAETSATEDLAKLLKLRDVEARRAATLSTKLRLCPQSRSDRHVAERLARAAGQRPWEVDGGEEFFRGPRD